MATRVSSRDEGFTLAGLIIILTVIMIFVAYTVPQQWSMVMARERDRQTIFIMRQYARAIYAFQEKHKTLPVGIVQLKEARSPRLIRGDGELENPMSGEMDWILIPPGQPGQIPPGQQQQPTGLPPPSTPGTPSQGTTGGNTKTAAGPFVGVRPSKTGKSFLSLNNAENYEQWSFTVDDLRNEIMQKNNALMIK